jgi:hypothetical protein
VRRQHTVSIDSNSSLASLFRFANKIFGYFLALTFLVLPSISIKIFST